MKIRRLIALTSALTFTVMLLTSVMLLYQKVVLHIGLIGECSD